MPLARKIDKLAGDAWKKVNLLLPVHAYLLMIVIDKPGVQPGMLSEELHLTPSTVTRLIEKLEDKKLGNKSYPGKNNRCFSTQKGKELAPKLKTCVQEFNTAYTDILGKEESEKLVRNMNKIADKLQ
jgi:DNA-binding MarR family transcriptional regulator